MDDLLCFHTQETIYGIPLKYVEETLAKQKITKVPRLNDKVSGLCNYKGIIYPVLSFDRLLGVNETHQEICMLLLRVHKYQVILEIHDIPYMTYGSSIVNQVPYEGGSEDIKIDQLCQEDNHYIYVLNMPLILDNIAEHILVNE